MAYRPVVAAINIVQPHRAREVRSLLPSHNKPPILQFIVCKKYNEVTQKPTKSSSESQSNELCAFIISSGTSLSSFSEVLLLQVFHVTNTRIKCETQNIIHCTQTHCREIDNFLLKHRCIRFSPHNIFFLHG
jgi:hypothetical protein